MSDPVQFPRRLGKTQHYVHVRGFWRTRKGQTEAVSPHMTTVEPSYAVTGAWDPTKYAGLDGPAFSAKISKEVFAPRFGMNVRGFTVREIEQLHYIYRLFALLKFPVRKLNRVLRHLTWDVKSHLHGVVAMYEGDKEHIRFMNVAKFPYTGRAFDPRNFDTAFSEVLFHELGHAIDEFLDVTGRVSDDERDLWATLCGWKNYSDRTRSPLELLTAYARTNPEEAHSEYFSAYITHQAKVHEMIQDRKTDPKKPELIYIVFDHKGRDIRPEYKRFLWIVNVTYKRMLE